MNSKRHLLRSSCAGSYGFDIGGKYDSGFSHHPGHLHTHTHTARCTLLLIQSLSLPSALLEEFDLTWESMNSSTQQNIALPQSTGSRKESVLYADVSLDMLLDELSLLFGYYLCDKGTFVQKCTIAVVLSIPTTFKSDQDFCA